MRRPIYLPVTVILLVAASVAGWFGGQWFGVDPGRLPKPKLVIGQGYSVAAQPEPALAAFSAAALRDARFARTNGIDIQARLDTGTVFVVPPGTTVRVLREDLDLALANADTTALPAEFWIGIDCLLQP